jgi:hypothetical protein
VKPGRLPLGHQWGGDHLRVLGVHHAVDGVRGRQADLAVQFLGERSQPFALGGRVVLVGVRQRVERRVEQQPDVVGGENLLLDRVHDERVKIVHQHRDPRAGRPVVPSRTAEVAPRPLAQATAGDQRDAPAARTAAQERRQEPVPAHHQAVGAVSSPLLPRLALELPLRLHPGEGLVIHCGLVSVTEHDLAVVLDVAAVDRVLEDVVDVPGSPGPRRHLSGVVRLRRRPDPLAGQLVGDPRPTVVALVGHTEDPLDDLEVLPARLGHHELPAALDRHRRVAEGRRSVGPEALARLGQQRPLHVLRQLLGVALRQPRQDRADQLAHRAVADLVLRQRHDVDVGLV